MFRDRARPDPKVCVWGSLACPFEINIISHVLYVSVHLDDCDFRKKTTSHGGIENVSQASETEMHSPVSSFILRHELNHRINHIPMHISTVGSNHSFRAVTGALSSTE